MRFVALSGCLLLCLLVLIACNRSGAGTDSQATPSAATTAATPTSTPVAITAAELKKLNWIEGTWRGTGVVQKPFYERYKFEDASALVMEELADETASTVTRTTRYELKDGKFGNERYVATALDDRSVIFSPLTPGPNSFRWQTESKDAWTAILTLPATATTSKETVYKMERIK